MMAYYRGFWMTAPMTQPAVFRASERIVVRGLGCGVV